MKIDPQNSADFHLLAVDFLIISAESRKSPPSRFRYRIGKNAVRVSLYGLGRYPVTLYKEQWEKVFSFVDTIKQFIIQNDSELKTK